MDLYSLFFFAWLITSLCFWIMAFNKLRMQDRGLRYFFGHLAGIILALSVFSFLMFASVRNCIGQFCGLGELLITLGVIIVTLFFYPLLLTFVLAKNRARYFPSKQQDTLLGQEDILDDLI